MLWLRKNYANLNGISIFFFRGWNFGEKKNNRPVEIRSLKEDSPKAQLDLAKGGKNLLCPPSASGKFTTS